MDPDPEVADKMATKHKFLFQSFFANTSVKKKSQNSNKIKVFLTFLHIDGFYGMLISMSFLFYGWEFVSAVTLGYLSQWMKWYFSSSCTQTTGIIRKTGW
jgi:hypothetical protein